MPDRRVTDDMVTRALEVLESWPGPPFGRDLVRRALEDALLAPGAAAVTTEYAEPLNGDSDRLWKPSILNDDRAHVVRKDGRSVLRRSIIVVDDWTEVTGP